MRKYLCVLFALLLAALLLPLCALGGTSEISGVAWYDTNGTGLYSHGARAISRASVTLLALEADGSERTLQQKMTDAGGAYSFTGLEAGQYRLRVTLPSDHLFIEPRPGGSIMLPAVGSSSVSMPIDLAEGQTMNSAHIGASKSSCYIRASLFEDANQNGGRSTVERALRGVSVFLYYEVDGQWIAVAEEKSDGEGNATFWKLTPGTYRMGVTLPDPYIIGPLGEKINGWYNCIPPCDSSTGMSEPQRVERGTSLGMGIGAVSTGSAQGLVWWDENMNGQQDAAEGGFAGATVTLSSDRAGVRRQVQTGPDGVYRFERLLAGEYTLTVELPDSAMFTLPGGGSLFSEGYSFSASAGITVTSQQETAVKPVGVMPCTSLAVQLYNDLNVNGAFDADEPAFAGALLEVLADDEVRASALSDGQGVARIPVLRGGDVSLRVLLPDGQAFTVSGLQNDFFAPAATGDLTQPLQLPHGQETLLHAGVTLPASVSGTLFDDANLSGMLDGQERGLAGFTVQAVNAEGDVALQTQTDADGRYTLGGLLPAPHTIRFLLVDAYVFTDYSDTGAAVENHVILQTPAYGETELLALSPGQSLNGVSGGVFRSATVSGSVLLESGVPSLPASGGMADVLVTLLDASGAPVSDTTTARTDASGAFYLKGALPGTYMLEYLLPEGAAFTRPETGAESVVTAPFTVGVGDDLTLASIGAIHTGTMWGTLYRDSDLSASFGAGDPVLGGVRVTLENTDLGLLYETDTLENGQYIFDALRPGAYTMRLTLPAELCFAYDAASPFDPHADSQGTASFSIGIGEALEARSIAAAAPARLNGTVYFDLLNNGLRDGADAGAPGITLSLKSDNGPQSYSLQTDAQGVFSLDALVPGNYTMRVTLPGNCIPAQGNGAVLAEGFWTSTLSIADGEDAAPAYGILRYARLAGHVWSMDGTLTGVAGRTVTLYDETGAALNTVQTDETGAFAFLQLKPGGYAISCDLPEGAYKFARTPDTASRASYILGDASRIVQGVGTSDVFTVPMGEDMATCDIGIGAMGALGDTAWLDENGNGLQDANEPCIPGIQIELIQYGQVVAQTVTDGFGRYLIADLYPGSYTLRVTLPDELRTTQRRSDYPLVASVLPDGREGVAEAEGIIVPSAGRNLNCDLGFVLLQNGKYPDSMKDLLTTDWSFDGRRR